MEPRHDEARFVCTDGDQAEIEGTAEFADLFEDGAVRKVGVLGSVVVFAFWNFGDGSVAGVATTLGLV
jgi:hypothetical protein